MTLIDANAILRILPSDNAEMVGKTKAFIGANPVLIRNEVMAEIVYVLQKVYKLPRETISSSLKSVIQVKNINAESAEITVCALNLYCESGMDFVDCLLCAYSSVGHHGVFTFDKKIMNRIKPQ